MAIGRKMLIGGTIYMVAFTALMAAMPVIMNSVPKLYTYLQEKFSTSHTAIDRIKAVGRLKKALSEIKGQNEAKEKIINALSGWLESKENPDSQTGGLVIHLAGVSGTGKSMAAEAITEALLGGKSKSIKISYSSIDSQSPKTVAEQLFGQTEQNFGQIKVDKNTPLTSQLKFNPKTVVEIHEFDKFMEKDDSLQAKLWDIADNGKIDVNGQALDCRDTVFVLTSNSSKESIGAGTDAEDTTKSLEKVHYRQVFLNRINTIYFENFSVEEYKDIVVQKFKIVTDYYLKKFHISITFDPTSLDRIAKELKDKKVGGARNVRPVIDKLYIALSEIRKGHTIPKGKTLFAELKYSEHGSCFFVNKMHV